MNAERRPCRGVWWVPLVVWLALDPARAGTGMDRLTTPILDPLATLPPQPGTARKLPGDEAAYECASADTLPTLTLTQAVQQALCQNPRVRLAMASIQRQAAQLGESRAAYLPSLSIGASSQRQTTQRPESQFILQQDQKSTSHFATLTWRLLDGGGRNASHRMAQALLSAALATQDAELQQLFTQTTTAYFDAQTARANHEAKVSGEDLARQTLDVSRKLQSRGIGSQSQTLQAKVALAKAELDRVRSRGQYEKSILALQVIMALPASQWTTRNWELEGDLDDHAPMIQQALSDWLTLAMEQHPALLAARLETRAAREKLRVIQSEGLPTLDFTQSQYVNGRPNQGWSGGRSKESVTGITLNIPLFDGFSRTYKVRAAQAQIDSQEAEASRLEAQVLSDIAKAHTEADAALKSLASSQALLTAAQEALASVRRKFEAGVSDMSEMLQVQAALADAQQERIRSLSEWKSASLRLLANAGVAGLKDR